MVKHTPAYRARRKRMRDLRKLRQRMRRCGFNPIYISVHADTRELVSVLEEARARIAGLFAVETR